MANAHIWTSTHVYDVAKGPEEARLLTLRLSSPALPRQAFSSRQRLCLGGKNRLAFTCIEGIVDHFLLVVRIGKVN